MKGDTIKAYPAAEQLEAFRKDRGLSPQTFSDRCVARAYLIQVEKYDKYSAEKIVNAYHANQVSHKKSSGKISKV